MDKSEEEEEEAEEKEQPLLLFGHENVIPFCVEALKGFFLSLVPVSGACVIERERVTIGKTIGKTVVG